MMTLNRLLLIGGVMIGLWLITPVTSAQERYPLTVQPTPADSRVRILNIHPSYRPGIRLPPGTYHLEISHDGYQTVTQWVRLKNQPLTVAVTLPPLENQATVTEPAPPVAEPPPPAAAPVQSSQPGPPPAAVAPRMETKTPQVDKPRVTDPALAAALQSGDLRLWQVIFATPPPTAEWLSALRASPIYWLLSPMTWFWLLLIWAVLVSWNRGWRLSTFGGRGLLALILALPIGWLFYWGLWTGFMALLASLAFLWVAPSFPWPRMIVAGSAAGLVAGSAVGLGRGLSAGLGGLVAGSAAGLSAGFGVGLSAGSAAAIIAGSAAGLVAELSAGSAAAIIAGSATGLVAELSAGSAARLGAELSGIYAVIVAWTVAWIIVRIVAWIVAQSTAGVARTLLEQFYAGIFWGFGAGMAALFGAGMGAAFGGVMAAAFGAIIYSLNVWMGAEIDVESCFLISIGLSTGLGAVFATWVVTQGAEEIGMWIGTWLSTGLVAGLGAGSGAGSSILYLQTTFWNHYFFSTTLDSLLLISAVLLMWLGSVLLSARFLPWIKASKQAAYWICEKDYHRVCTPGLPWLVRWSGRLLMKEVPCQHEDFADYFVCRYCGQRDFMTAKRLIGVIGAIRSTTTPDGLNVPLFDSANRQARSADIDCLDLYPPPPGQTLDYDYAVNAVLNALSEDHHRSRPLKKIPVRIHDQPPLPENTRRMLADRFNLLTS